MSAGVVDVTLNRHAFDKNIDGTWKYHWRDLVVQGVAPRKPKPESGTGYIKSVEVAYEIGKSHERLIYCK
jgi:hypothetical protein